MRDALAMLRYAGGGRSRGLGGIEDGGYSLGSTERKAQRKTRQKRIETPRYSGDSQSVFTALHAAGDCVLLRGPMEDCRSAHGLHFPAGSRPAFACLYILFADSLCPPCFVQQTVFSAHSVQFGARITWAVMSQ